MPNFEVKDDWFVPMFDNQPSFNISEDDLEQNLQLLKKFQKSNSDEDFWTLIKTIQKQKGTVFVARLDVKNFQN